jgi:hypothetical protein
VAAYAGSTSSSSSVASTMACRQQHRPHGSTSAPWAGSPWQAQQCRLTQQVRSCRAECASCRPAAVVTTVLVSSRHRQCSNGTVMALARSAGRRVQVHSRVVCIVEQDAHDTARWLRCGFF